MSLNLAEGHADASTYLPEGNYEVLLSGEGIESDTGDPLGELVTDPYGTFREDYVNRDLFFVNADFDRDRSVALSDFLILRANFGMFDGVTTVATFADGDATGDGQVDLSDFLLLRASFGKTIDPAPVTPNQLSQAGTSVDSATLTWMAPTWAHDGFRVWRGTDPFDLEQVAELRPGDYGQAGSTITWTDDGNGTGLTDGTTYWYRVRAFTDAGGNTHTTNKIRSVTLLPTVVEPAAIIQTNGDVLFEWQTLSTTHDQFRVEYSSDGGNNWQLASIQTNSAAQSLLVPGLPNPETLQFQIRAEQVANGEVYNFSVYTMPFVATADGFDITATTNGTDEILLDWEQVFPGTGAGYYALAFSNDGGVTFYDEAHTGSANGSVTEATLVGPFEEDQAFWIQAKAYDNSDNLLESSDVVQVSFTEGSGAALPPPQAPAALPQPAGTVDEILIAFNGAVWPGDGNLSVVGNRWFERIIRDTDMSLRTGAEKTYRESPTGYQQAKADFLDRVDKDNDGEVSEAEADGVKVVIVGYSWGGIAAVNFSRLLTSNGFLGSGVDITVERLITIDPVRWGPFRTAFFLKPLHGGVLQNVENYDNYYQRRGGGVSFDYYVRFLTQNGSSIPFGKVGTYDVDDMTMFGAFRLRGNEIPANRVPAANRRQINISDRGVIPATNVQFWLDPVDGVQDYDGILEGQFVQHDMMPYYVRGGVGVTSPYDGDNAPNVLQDIADAFA